MTDLTSKRLIVTKGLLFLGLALLASGTILLAAPGWRTAVLLLLAMWAAARFYYFLFYVLEKYVDPTIRYAGVLALLRELKRRRPRGGA